MLEKHGVTLFIKRDDLIHKDVSGNKWRKLKFNFKAAKDMGYENILTFGGAYSNHIVATAVAAKEFNFKAIGIIRGEELNKDSNHTLSQASESDMDLKFISRSEYRLFRKSPELIQKEFPCHFIIPEGGCNRYGIEGISEILNEITFPFDWIIAAVGTGATITGLSKSNGEGHVMGISVLKANFIREDIRSLHEEFSISDRKVSLNCQYHFGGYGKYSSQLITFINRIREETGLLLDPIYTGKAFFGVWDMIQQGIFDNRTLIFLHTGGLQGIKGFNQKSPRKIHI